MEKGVIPPGVSQRCPKCHKLTCSFDVEKNGVVCSSCGFETRLKI